MAISRVQRRLAWIGLPVVLIILVVMLWDWDWFVPLVESRASAALGRTVTIKHLHVRLFPPVRVAVDDLVVANPSGWPAGDPPFVTMDRLTLDVDAWRYVTGKGLVIPLIALEAPHVLAAETKDGAENFKVSTGGGGGGPSPQIGDLRIDGGQVHVVMPKLKSDFNATVATQGQGDAARITVEAKGTYADQPITGRLVGGAVLSLRDPDHPWPVTLNLANGPTRVALDGTLRDPVAFKGADVRLKFSGPDMGLLEPLVGFPIPKTPAYDIAGRLNLDGLNKIQFTDFAGRMGSSDIGGTIEEQPNGTGTKPKPVVTLNLQSKRVDLVDLAGFIGGTPGRATTKDATPREREATGKAHGGKLLPDTPINIPRLNWADIHLHYHGGHIEGRDMPLDDLTVALDVVDGAITIHPISFGVGKGRLLANVALTPTSGKDVHAKVDLRLQNLDVSRMMAATHTFQGAGSVSGIGVMDATGDSLASLLGNGNGEVKMAMAGGDLSAVLIDLTGLQFGNALLSALGVPNKTEVQCFVGDLVLKQGVLDFPAMVLDTKEAVTNVGGNLNLSKETLDLTLKTDAKHFSVGSLPTRIDISGTFTDPSIRPGAEVAARAGAAVGLGVLFAPLALLPTVQFGTSEKQDARCGTLLDQARASAGGKALPPPIQGASVGH